MTSACRIILLFAALLWAVPTALSSEPAVVSRPSSVVSPPPSAVSSQPSAIAPAPSAISSQPSAIAPAPSAISSQPSAIAPAPSAISNEPSVVRSPSSVVSPPPSATSLDDKHKLAIGDRLSFRIIEDLDEPKPLVITDSGELEIPYIGRFPALAKTCRQLAAELKTELEKEYYYQATVILAVDQMTKSRGKVYLVGFLRAAGVMDIPSDEELTVSKAILRAGGFTDFADKKHVRITRKKDPADTDSQTLIVNVAEVLEKGRIDLDVKLEPGDLVFVPGRSFNF